MEQTKQTILCVDNNTDNGELVKVMFGLTGYRVTNCCTSNEGMLRAQEVGFAAIILENRLEDVSGLEICREIRNSGKLTPIIFFTTEARPQEKQKGLEAGADAYLIKPNDLDVLTETVIRFIEKNHQGCKTFELMAKPPWMDFYDRL